MCVRFQRNLHRVRSAAAGCLRCYYSIRRNCARVGVVHVLDSHTHTLTRAEAHMKRRECCAHVCVCYAVVVLRRRTFKEAHSFHVFMPARTTHTTSFFVRVRRGCLTRPTGTHRTRTRARTRSQTIRNVQSPPPACLPYTHRRLRAHVWSSRIVK